MLNDFTWDSMAIVTVMAILDDMFGVVVSGEKLNACQTVGDVFALVGAA